MAAVLDLASIRPAFADPVGQSQKVFRAVMEAMARPGTIADLAFAPEPPAGLSRAAAVVGLTLFDFETPVWLAPTVAASEAAAWLRFHCGCPLSAEPGAATFAVVGDALGCPPLLSFNQGDARYPDRSATIILDVRDLSGGDDVVLTGPGIKSETIIAPVGLPKGFWDQVVANHEQFQFGVDLMLVAETQLIALPRSTRVEFKGG